MSSIGTTLSEERMNQRVSLAEVERETRIRSRYLDALEKDDFESLPGASYARAFIKEYASFLKLDPGPLVREFNEIQNARPREQSSDPTIILPQRRSRREFGRPRPKLNPLFLIAAVAGALLVIWMVSGLVAGLFRGGSGDATEHGTKVIAVEERAGTSPQVTVAGNEGGNEGGSTSSGSATASAVRVATEVIGDEGCWLRAVADGKLMYQGVLEPGTKRTFSADRNLVLRVGNAAALKVSANGGPAQVLGAEDLIVEKKFDRRSR